MIYQILAQITNPAIGGPQGESALGAYIGVAVKTVLILGAVAVLLLLAWGAFQILTSGGDAKAHDKGRNIITNAVIGLVILVALFPIIKALEVILNISILNLNFPSVTLAAPALAFSGGSIEGGAGGWPFGDLGQIRDQFFISALLIGGLICLALIAFGAIRFIMSGGDKMQTDAAKKVITAAVIGLLLLVAAYPLGLIIEKVLGVPVTGSFNWPRVGGGSGDSDGGSGGGGDNNNNENRCTSGNPFYPVGGDHAACSNWVNQGCNQYPCGNGYRRYTCSDSGNYYIECRCECN